MKKGITDGLPIGLGYLAVSFAFGILASANGLYWWEALLISMTNLTSAGQFAGLTVMLEAGTLLEMASVQFVINLRYALMSLSLAQKADSDIKGFWRFLVPAFHTDEIFAVAIGKNGKIDLKYMQGLVLLPYIGWSLGTLLGAVFGAILPDIVSNALGIALYGMFIAIVVPEMKKSKAILLTVCIALTLSSACFLLPILQKIPSGFTVIICAIIASGIGALLFPIRESQEAAS